SEFPSADGDQPLVFASGAEGTGCGHPHAWRAPGETNVLMHMQAAASNKLPVSQFDAPAENMSADRGLRSLSCVYPGTAGCHMATCRAPLKKPRSKFLISRG